MIGFMYKGVFITDPTKDETGTYDVPKGYYPEAEVQKFYLKKWAYSAFNRQWIQKINTCLKEREVRPDWWWNLLDKFDINAEVLEICGLEDHTTPEQVEILNWVAEWWDQWFTEYIWSDTGWDEHFKKS